MQHRTMWDWVLQAMKSKALMFVLKVIVFLIILDYFIRYWGYSK